MDRTFSISVYTLGCRLNQVESEAVSSAFLNAGFTLARQGSVPDIFVINTCTVTSKSEQKARRVIRKASSENPGSLVVVTGCYAQLNAPDIEKLGSNILVIG
ncbi:MAG: tRNA (N(6)-L-threonylcarbamoyladenosine(37)-C(2))-methylthiotransferase MtaB, partial [Spirochaetales bacterium]|nr:tRNA (N(6)-L-threonylcarbamoyladenosine(37)-C(2))-methylthiotransferase MtaB [Spirochaetales bacterium]